MTALTRTLRRAVRGGEPAVAQMPEVPGRGPRVIVFNFDRLEYMHSIGLLVTLLVRANRQRQALLACGLNGHDRQVFELTHLDEAIAIQATEADAPAAGAV